MSISVTERHRSRIFSRGRVSQEELRYRIKGTAEQITREEAEEALLAAAPVSNSDGWPRQAVSVDPVHADNEWNGSVVYGPSTSGVPHTGQSAFSFTTAGGTARIKESLQTVGTFPVSAPNHNQLIGVTDTGVEGTDVVVPQYAWTETVYKPDSEVTQAYRVTLANLTGTVNQDPFRGFPAGQVLFLGVRGAKRPAPSGEDDWELAFQFQRNPDASNLTIGEITGINKAGHDYLWVRTKTVENADRTVENPEAVYVERVYRRADFSELEI